MSKRIGEILNKPKTINLVPRVAAELSFKEFQVQNVINLLFEEECTIPFVARYRKEMTGGVDEVGLRAIRDRYYSLNEIETLRGKYLKVVFDHCQRDKKLSFNQLERQFLDAKTKQELEDLYLPFKPKRRTRAQAAKEQGLEPLLEQILEQRGTLEDLASLAQEYLTSETKSEDGHGVTTIQEALGGASDIFAERVNETAEFRSLVRELSFSSGMLTAHKAEGKAETKAPGSKQRKNNQRKYENYYDYKESINKAPSHRVMAVRRGEAEKYLRVAIEVDGERILPELTAKVLGESVATDAVKRFLTQATEDSYKRLMSASIESEMRLYLKNKAESESITVFSSNLKNLLLLPPIPEMVVLGVDPGIRTGSKLACVDRTGKCLETATIYPDFKKEESSKNTDSCAKILSLIKQHEVKVVAIGNGTGGREINRFITKIFKKNEVKDVKRVVVNEAGASVYSTDEIAREEFPDLDATLRSAVSIARRLQDPLAELVKVSPRSIGVGQYQHDVNPTKLGRSLEEVVESCVNKVGVNLNTASYKLLSYVSGVGPTLAKNIVSFRDSNGTFRSRESLTRVSGFGPKAFQQAAGFLRVPESENPLDNSAVHPERYGIVESVAKDLGKGIKDMIGDKSLVLTIPWEKYVTKVVGMPTLQDIADEIVKPGRDPREDGIRLLFSDEITELEDLKIGMQLKGTVTNVTNFGAFVDIGVHQDGLIHLSELTDKFVKDPIEVVSVGDVLDVRIMEVDLERRRISLSSRSQSERPRERPSESPRNNRQDFKRPQRPNRDANTRPSGQRNNKDSRDHSKGSRKDIGRRGRQQRPEQKFTMEDLVNKFGKK